MAINTLPIATQDDLIAIYFMYILNLYYQADLLYIFFSLLSLLLGNKVRRNYDVNLRWFKLLLHEDSV